MDQKVHSALQKGAVRRAGPELRGLARVHAKNRNRKHIWWNLVRTLSAERQKAHFETVFVFFDFFAIFPFFKFLKIKKNFFIK